MNIHLSLDMTSSVFKDMQITTVLVRIYNSLKYTVLATIGVDRKCHDLNQK
jgi:hypothetical protein